MSFGVARRERVHDATEDLLQRPAALHRVRAEAAHRPRTNPAEARRERALEGVAVVRTAQRLEVADEKPHHLVACGRAPTPHLIRKAERAQRLLERRAQSGRAAEHDREVGKAQPWAL